MKSSEGIKNIGVLSLLSALIIGIASYGSYLGYRKIIISSHNDVISLHQNSIIKSVHAYNATLGKLYKKIDIKKHNNIIKQLDSFKITKESELDTGKVKVLARQENVNIELVDKQSTKVLFDTKGEYTGVVLNKWERAGTNIKITEPGKVHYHFTWCDVYFYLLVYFQPLQSDFVWVIYQKYNEPDSRLHQIVSQFKFDELIKENFDYFGLFDSYLCPVHSLNNFPKHLFRSNNFDSRSIEKSGVTFSWIPIAPSDEKFPEKYVRYIGLGTKTDRHVESKIANIRIGIILASIALWLCFIIAFVFIRQKYLRLLGRINEQIKSCIIGAQEHIYLDNSFPCVAHRLSNSFNEYLGILDKKIQESRTLASQIFNAWDNAKKKINQDLHDTTGQLLIAANLKLAKNPDTLDARDLIQRASQELRTVYETAEPPGLDTIGLEKALQWYIIKFFPEGFLYFLNIDIQTTLSGYYTSQIYRVTQEIIANARKHNQDISYFNLSIRQESNTFIIRAENDCDKQNGPLNLGNGLQNIKLRVETLAGYVNFTRIDSEFVVEASIPLTRI